jgi:hypothetical protein
MGPFKYATGGPLVLNIFTKNIFHVTNNFWRFKDTNLVSDRLTNANRTYSPWATNIPPPPRGIFKAMIFWKFVKNAKRWDLFALWQLGL